MLIVVDCVGGQQRADVVGFALVGGHFQRDVVEFLGQLLPLLQGRVGVDGDGFGLVHVGDDLQVAIRIGGSIASNEQGS